MACNDGLQQKTAARWAAALQQAHTCTAPDHTAAGQLGSSTAQQRASCSNRTPIVSKACQPAQQHSSNTSTAYQPALQQRSISAAQPHTCSHLPNMRMPALHPPASHLVGVARCLALLVERHHHQRRAVLLHNACLLPELLFALLERDGVHDALALQAHREAEGRTQAQQMSVQARSTAAQPGVRCRLQLNSRQRHTHCCTVCRPFVVQSYTAGKSSRGRGRCRLQLAQAASTGAQLASAANPQHHSDRPPAALLHTHLAALEARLDDEEL